MARIKFNDLPKDMKISRDDMRKITGGALIPDYQSSLGSWVENPMFISEKQQMTQMMSNIQKSAHDTLQNIINNLK